MNETPPPTIDAVAASRWAGLPGAASPWLHEEVGRRMEERLQWIKLQPSAWLDWAPWRGGMAVHERLLARYPRATAHVHEPAPAHATRCAEHLSRPWWQPERWRRPAHRLSLPPEGGVQMVWANMALHASARPQAMLAEWHRALAVDGFLMFSCLGPDTLKELHAAYARAGWSPPGHACTDMHDWGDMLVEAGFAEPVMDMERIVLTFESPERLLQELRELGRNLHPGRSQTCRGRGWREQLLAVLASMGPSGETPGPIPLTFEIIYGHAFKPQPKVKLAAESTVSLEEMRQVLRQGKKNLRPV